MPTTREEFFRVLKEISVKLDRVGRASTIVKSTTGVDTRPLLQQIENAVDGVEALLTTISGLDFSTETTLASLDGKDFATQTTLAGILADTASIDGKDFATQTTLSSLEGKDFATQTTLSSVDSRLNTIDTVLDNILSKLTTIENNTDGLEGIDYATENTLDDFRDKFGLLGSMGLLIISIEATILLIRNDVATMETNIALIEDWTEDTSKKQFWDDWTWTLRSTFTCTADGTLIVEILVPDKNKIKGDWWATVQFEDITGTKTIALDQYEAVTSTLVPLNCYEAGLALTDGQLHHMPEPLTTTTPGAQVERGNIGAKPPIRKGEVLRFTTGSLLSAATADKFHLRVGASVSTNTAFTYTFNTGTGTFTESANSNTIV